LKPFLIISGLVVAVGAMAAVLAIPAFKRHAALKVRAESDQCGNFMCSIGFAALFWANDHHTNLPSDFLSMSNELTTPFILICPGDNSRRPATDWASFSTNNSSYEIVTLGLHAGDSNGVFLRCKVHGHLGYGDATVFDGERRRTKIPDPESN
jgi:hypothetical protein